MRSESTFVARRHFLGEIAAGALASATAATAEELKDGVLYPKKLPPDESKFSWYDAVIQKIPKLKHARGSRWPLITWEGFSNQPQKLEYYHSLLERGLAQHIRLKPEMIELALAIQRSGMPVIVMEGASGVFPSNLAGDPPNLAHQFDEGYKPKEYVRPCPSLQVGWAKFADKLRDTLRQYKEKGVVIDAIWNDWENDPLYGDDRHEQATHCQRCRELLPRKTMSNAELFKDYTARKFYELFGAYYAAPVLEYYPKCSLTNWLAQPSTPEEPQPGWAGNRGRIHMPPMVTAWNPTAYGAASWVWKGRKKEDKRSQELVDQVYTNLLLRQVSLAGKLSDRWTPEKESIPWVARWITEPPELEYPVLTRPRYREILRHLWLRGVDAMQVFSPRMKTFEDMALPEIEDATTVYDEMLAFREFLDAGAVLNYEVPKVHDEGVVWSGMRVGDRAVVRMFKQGGGSTKATISPWEKSKFDLDANSSGATYLLSRDGKATSVS